MSPPSVLSAPLVVVVVSPLEEQAAIARTIARTSSSARIFFMFHSSIKNLFGHISYRGYCRTFAAKNQQIFKKFVKFLLGSYPCIYSPAENPLGSSCPSVQVW